MTTKQNKRAAREKLAEERKRQADAARKRQIITNIAVGVVVVVAIVGILWYAVAQKNKTDTTLNQDAAKPALVHDNGGGMTFGDGPVTVDLWEDFQCPHCKEFEATNGKMLTEKVNSGEITMVVHPLSFLDDNLGNESSALAANAFGCSAASGEEAAMAYHSKIFTEQPPEESMGAPAWSNDDLISWGKDVGVDDGDWSNCVADNTYGGWVDQVAASQVDAGVSSTPTITINGETFKGNWLDVNEVTSAIESAGK